jgi:peptidoglycan/LPS O-acetylase OafA/YrhL
MNRVRPLDSIRAICAFWVFLSHLGAPPILALLPGTSHGTWLNLLQSAEGVLFNGGAAVMCFFIISGFCIHYPLKDRALATFPFLIRRLVRISIPLLVVEIFVYFFGMRDSVSAVEWSIICEIIYYLLYPVLRMTAKNEKWMLLNCIAFAAALLLSLVPDNNAGFFWAYGNAWTWILGLPVWLLGVSIAHYASLNAPLERPIWLYRLFIWALSSYFVALHFHSSIHYKHTFLIFSVPAALWIVAEMRNSRSGNYSPILESFGAWSYSLYLCHRFVMDSNWASQAGSFIFPDLPLCKWILTIILGVGISLLFYVFCERPAHNFARFLSRKFANRHQIG